MERKRDPASGDYFEKIEGMLFKEGFLYKNVSLKSLSTQNVQPTFDELEKFRQPVEAGDGDMSSLSTLFANRKKGHFMKGDRVIVVKGDLRNLKGSVEKVEEDTVHIKPNEKGLPVSNCNIFSFIQYPEFHIRLDIIAVTKKKFIMFYLLISENSRY